LADDGAQGVEVRCLASFGKGGVMAKVIKCVCGHVVRGESDEELLDAAEIHIRDMHPELKGKVTREDLVAMVELVA
jgi:predicted small metal-binding protein